jgi:plasmid replication initiation protein
MKDMEICRYILQPNVISRASYSLSTTARRLIAMAMSALPTDGSSYEVSFPISEFEKALGIERGGLQREHLINGIKECLNCLIEISIPQEDGKIRWVGFTWFIKSVFDEKLDRIEMVYNPLFGEAIKEFKKAYAKLDLINFGKLRSSYAIRYYEIAMSYHGFAGKDGNSKNTWYFEKTLTELRKLFRIEKNKYKITHDFRLRIIENPIKELNEAEIGLKITPKYIRERKFLVGVKFICKFVGEKPKKGAQKAIEAQEMPVSDKREDISPKEIEELREKHPAEWQQFYDEARQERIAFQEKVGMGIPLNEKMIEEITFTRLKEHLGL